MDDGLEIFRIFGRIFLKDDNVKKSLDDVDKSARKTADGLDEAGAAAEDTGNWFSKVKMAAVALGTALAIITGAATAVGTSAVKMAGQVEQDKIAFERMLGSAEKAGSFLQKLSKFAAETPFELPGLKQASRQLLAFRFDSEAIIPMMQRIGDAVAGIGGGEAEIQRVQRALGQLKMKGKATNEEFMQLSELGINAYEYLAQKVNMTVPELQKAMEKGTIDAKTAIIAIMEGMDKDFGGMMEKQAGTLFGLWSTFKDNIRPVLTEIGDWIVKTFDLKGKLKVVNSYLGQFSQDLQKHGFKEAFKNLLPKDFETFLEKMPEKARPYLSFLKDIVDMIVLVATTIGKGIDFVVVNWDRFKPILLGLGAVILMFKAMQLAVTASTASFAGFAILSLVAQLMGNMTIAVNAGTLSLSAFNLIARATQLGIIGIIGAITIALTYAFREKIGLYLLVFLNACDNTWQQIKILTYKSMDVIVSGLNKIDFLGILKPKVKAAKAWLAAEMAEARSQIALNEQITQAAFENDFENEAKNKGKKGLFGGFGSTSKEVEEAQKQAEEARKKAEEAEKQLGKTDWNGLLGNMSSGGVTGGAGKEAEKKANKLADLFSDLAAKLEANRIKAAALGAEYNKTQKDLDAYSSALDRLLEIDPQNSRIEEYKAQIKALGEEVKTNEGLKQLHEIFKNFAKSIISETANIKLFSFDSNAEDLKTQYDITKMTADKLKQEMQQLNDIINDPNSKQAVIDEARAKLAKITPDYEAAERKARELNAQIEDNITRYQKFGEKKVKVDEQIADAQNALNNITKLGVEELENWAVKLSKVIPLDAAQAEALKNITKEFVEQAKAINQDSGALDRYNAYLEQMKKIPELLNGAKDKLAEMAGVDLSLPEWEQLARDLEANADIAPELTDELYRMADALREAGNAADNMSTLKGFFNSVGSTFGISGITDQINSVIDSIPKIKNVFADVGGRGGWGAIFDQGQNGGLLGGLGTIGSLLGPAGTIFSAVKGFFGLFGKKSKEQMERENFAKSLMDYFDTSKFVGKSDHFNQLIEKYKKTGDKAAKEFVQRFTEIAKTLESGISSALGGGIKDFLEGGKNWLKKLRDGIKGAIIDAITKAAIEGAMLKGAFGNLLTQLTEGLANGQDVSGIIAQISAAIPDVAGKIEQALSPLRDSINTNFSNSNTPVSNGSNVYRPQNVTNSSSSTMTVGEININAQGSNYDPRRLLDDLIKEAQRRGLRLVVQG